MGNGALVIVPVTADVFPDWAEVLSWHFDSFAERSSGANTVESIAKSVLDRETQCWVVMDGAAVKACALTHIANDAGKTCIILACAGEDFQSWFEFLFENLYAWSKEVGSSKLEIHARPGWEKFLKPLGLKKTHTVMEISNV